MKESLDASFAVYHRIFIREQKKLKHRLLMKQEYLLFVFDIFDNVFYAF